MTQDANLKIGGKTNSRRNKDQHAVGCEYIHIDAIGGQLTVYGTAGVCRELRNKFIAARQGQLPWSIMAFVCTAREFQPDDVVSSGIFADKFADRRPSEWIKQALITLEEATEAYMVEVTAEFHC